MTAPLDVMKDWEGFNPARQFTILFNLHMERRSRHWEPSAMLTTVWNAPVLPGPEDIIHLGPTGFDIVLEMPRRCRRTIWDSSGAAASMHARLLHITTLDKFMQRMAGLFDHHPEYKAQIHVGPYITAVPELDAPDV